MRKLEIIYMYVNEYDKNRCDAAYISSLFRYGRLNFEAI